MAQNGKTKALTDLIDNPREIAAIMADPAEGGMRFYKALHHKEKQYVAFAAGLGLIAYGFFLKSNSKKETASASSHNTPADTTHTGSSTTNQQSASPNTVNSGESEITSDLQGGDVNGSDPNQQNG